MTYELVIGTKNWSSWSLRAWLALKACGVTFKETLIPLRQPESAKRIKKYSPSERIPVLRITDDNNELVVFDSLAICETLAERHPEARLWPTKTETRSLARSYSAEMHSGFLAFREALPMDFARILPTPDFDDEVQNQINRIQSSWEIALSQYNSREGFFLANFQLPIVCMLQLYHGF